MHPSFDLGRDHTQRDLRFSSWDPFNYQQYGSLENRIPQTRKVIANPPSMRDFIEVTVLERKDERTKRVRDFLNPQLATVEYSQAWTVKPSMMH